jgi:hypothetical protein
VNVVSPHRPDGEPTETTGGDVTVLRATSGGGGSGADTPRVLKQRFVLEAKLGSGGMGTVYRARDLRKVEARDRNPYVAIKVLNNDFRAHPDAFIALQREASKSQAIAHPNIVSIYDFDKDGDIPYMTMELLEGKELGELVKEFPNGLPDALLWPALEGICAGLKRAHDAGIIHADFKPGNVIVGKGGLAKILDFGIARAVRAHQYEGEDTVFDPAKLAALTPAYASREMLLGETPTARDDIYSFAVVAYLMITGRHPFDRTRADEAAKQQLVAERPRRLSNRQWRVLERCLAFEAAARPASMDEVIARMLRPSPLRPWLFGAAVLAAMFGGMLLWLGPPNVERQEVARTALAGAQTSRIEALLAEPSADAVWHDRLVEELGALAQVETPQSFAALRDRALSVYLVLIREAELPAAEVLLDRASRIAPEGRFDAGRMVVEAKSRVRFEEIVAARPKDAAWIAAVENHLDGHARRFFGSAGSLRMRLDAAAAFRDAASAALERKDVTRARALLEAAKRHEDDREGLAALATLEERLAALEATADAIAEERRRIEGARRVDQMLVRFTATTCESLDVARLGRDVTALRRDHPAEAVRIDRAVADYVAGCVHAVNRVDFERAVALRDDARRLFGPSPALEAVDLDPCGVDDLLGNGASLWRTGFCVDTLPDGNAGPRLVVVPFGDARLAVMKFEASWQLLRPFCSETGACPVRDVELPVLNVSIDVAERYAGWLSGLTGRGYRLPTLAEWNAFAGAGEPDPNRNCGRPKFLWWGGKTPVDVRAGAENGFGVVNALGNAREWARDGDGLVAAGGAFRDPPSECIADHVEAHDGRADAFTGFRLVRGVR